MSLGKKLLKFCNENVVLITGVGMIIGIHWMWDKLQHVPNLVPEKDRKEMPIIKAAKYVQAKLVEEISNFSDENNSKTSEN